MHWFLSQAGQIIVGCSQRRSTVLGQTTIYLFYQYHKGGRPPPPPNDCLRPPFGFTQNAFLDHHVTTRQQTKIEIGIITFKHNSRLKFSRFLAKLLTIKCCADT